jgi:hypothetical protein
MRTNTVVVKRNIGQHWVKDDGTLSTRIVSVKNYSSLYCQCLTLMAECVSEAEGWNSEIREAEKMCLWYQRDPCYLLYL